MLAYWIRQGATPQRLRLVMGRAVVREASGHGAFDARRDGARYDCAV